MTVRRGFYAHTVRHATAIRSRRPAPGEPIVASTFGARSFFEQARIPFHTGMEYVDWSGYGEEIEKSRPFFRKFLEIIERAFPQGVSMVRTDLELHFVEAVRSLVWARRFLEKHDGLQELHAPFLFNAHLAGYSSFAHGLNMENRALWHLAPEFGVTPVALDRIDRMRWEIAGAVRTRAQRLKTGLMLAFSPETVLISSLRVSASGGKATDREKVLFFAESQHLFRHFAGIPELCRQNGMRSESALWEDAGNPEARVLRNVYRNHARSRSAYYRARVNAGALLPELGVLAGEGGPLGRLMMPKWEVLLRYELPQAMSLFSFFGDFLSGTRPDLLVVADDTFGCNAAAVMAAREQGIPTFCVQHCHTPPAYLQNFTMRPNAEHYGVRGEKCGAALEEMFHPSAVREFHVLGRSENPSQTFFRGALRKKLGIPGEAPLVAFFSIGPGGQRHRNEMERARLYERLIQTFSRSGMYLVVRPHPSQIKGYFEGTILQAGSSRIIGSREGAVEEVLADADAVVFHSVTTVALDAMAFGKPLFLVEDCHPPGSLHFDDSPAMISVASVEDLPREIARVLENPGLRKRMLAAQKAVLLGWDIPLEKRNPSRWVEVFRKIMAEGSKERTAGRTR